MCGWFGNDLMTEKENKTVSTEKKENTTNCISISDIEKISETKEENNKEKNNTQQASTWKNIGTDLSKIEDIYTPLMTYTYTASRASGGYSFYNQELYSLALQSVKKEDLTELNEDVYMGTGYLKNDKIKSILNKYFGENYTLNPYGDLGGSFLFHMKSYDKEKDSFVVAYGGDGTQGPDIRKILRKVMNVYEKENDIKVEEKVIYLSSMYGPSNNIYYSIYKNPAKTIYITEKNYSLDGIENEVINVVDYLDKASTLTSIYRKDTNGEYHFIGSEITD